MSQNPSLNNTSISRGELLQKRVTIPISELRVWEKNPREIDKKDYERLKDRLRGRQFKPLLVTSEGVVLGGNMRLRAMKELGYTDVWVSVIEFVQEKGKWVAYINGEADSKIFDSREDAMLHYAITDNESFGKYIEMEIAELSQDSILDLENYKIPTGEFKSIKEILGEYGPPEEEIESLGDDGKEGSNKRVRCPKCNFRFEVDG